MEETLADKGEFRLLEELVLPRLAHISIPNGLGDDCAVITLPNNEYDLVVTTDKTPTPAVFHLGLEDFIAYGWFSVVVNASDLASAGATPLLFLSSVEALPEMKVSQFDDFFSGMAEACSKFRLLNAGGNINVGGKFSCHGCAIGLVPHGRSIGRAGCRPGDYLVAIGSCGSFICAFLRAHTIGVDSLSLDEIQVLLRPRPHLDAMSILRQAGIVSAASDNSDGILGAIQNISERSRCSIEIDMTEKLPSEVNKTADKFGYNPWNLAFFWGDWQVVCAIRANVWNEFVRICKKQQISYWKLGKATNIGKGLYGVTSKGRKSIRVLRNENFLDASYGANYNEHLRNLLETPIIE